MELWMPVFVLTAAYLPWQGYSVLLSKVISSFPAVTIAEKSGTASAFAVTGISRSLPSGVYAYHGIVVAGLLGGEFHRECGAFTGSDVAGLGRD